MKKNIAAAALAVLCLTLTASASLGRRAEPQYQEYELAEVKASACYADAVDNFEELQANAELVVKCTLDRVVRCSDYAQGALLSVSECYQGTLPTEQIEVRQMLDGFQVEDGHEYVLFLREHKYGNLKNVYDVVGGYQGVFKLGPDGSIAAASSMMESPNMLHWMDTYALD